MGTGKLTAPRCPARTPEQVRSSAYNPHDGTLRVSSAFTRTVAAPVLTTLRSARIRNGQPAPLAREPKCLLEPTCCRSGCSPDPGTPREPPPCPVNGGRPAAPDAVLVHNVRMPPSTKYSYGEAHGEARRHLPAHETQHHLRSRRWPGTQQKGPPSCRSWLAVVDPGTLPGPGFPFREQCSTADRLEIPARPGNALLWCTWCPNSTSDSVVSNDRWICLLRRFNHMST